MSRFLDWYILTGLNAMGWPKPKGIFRRPHVDSLVADMVVELGLQVIVGLGAGRPEVAVALLADTFAGNPWTEESTTDLIRRLGNAEDIVENHPEVAPWKALWLEHRFAHFATDWRWSALFDDRVGIVRASAASHAAYWGLTNEHLMQAIFEREKLNYERNTLEANQYSLGVSNTFPFESLEQFYESCDNFVHAFNLALPPFGSIPARLRAAPEIARRLSA